MKTRILYVIENGSFGGGERAFAQVVSGIDKDRYELYAACIPQGLYYEKIKINARVLPWEIKNRFDFKKISKLREIINENNIDIVHSQGPRADFYTRLAAKSTKALIVSTVATPVEDFDVNLFKKLGYILLDRFTERYVDRFIVVSEALKRRLIDTHKISPDRVSVIYNGVEIDEYDFTNASIKIREEFGVKEGMLLAGTAGRLVYQKGLPFFIRAVKYIKDKDPEISKNIKYIIVGEGALRKVLEKLADDLGVSENIIFTGFRTDVKNILSAMDIFVLSSVHEGQPLVILEAMASGKPIVSTDIEGINETIDNGLTGILVSPYDHCALAEGLLNLIKDKEKAQSLASAARKAVQEKFDIKDKIKRHEDLYEQLLSGKSNVC